MCALSPLSRLILWCCLCCLLAGSPIEAQESARLPTIIHRKISGYTKSSIRRGICPIIDRLAVATTLIATRLKSDTLTETSTPMGERTGSTFSIRPKRLNAIGIIRMGEIIRAHRRPIPGTRRISYTASHWEAPHDVSNGSQTRLPLTQETTTLAHTPSIGRIHNGGETICLPSPANRANSFWQIARRGLVLRSCSDRREESKSWALAGMVGFDS
jgi:hypothetical protein